MHGFPYALCTGSVSVGDITSDADWPDGASVISDSMDWPNGWMTRCNPLDGSLTIDALRITAYDRRHAISGRKQPWLTYLTTRRPESLSSTALAVSMSSSDTTFTVLDAAPINALSLPAVVWIEGEAILVQSINTGTKVATVATSGRGYLGTIARAHTVDARANLYPEVWCEFPHVYRRKAVLYLVEGTTANASNSVILYRGTAARPVFSGGKVMISVDHAWNRAREARLGSDVAATRLRGYDLRRVRFAAFWSAGSLEMPQTGIKNTALEAANAQAEALDGGLDAYETSGGLNFEVTASIIDSDLQVKMVTNGVTSPSVDVRRFGNLVGASARSSNTTSPITVIATVSPVPSAVVVMNRRPDYIPISTTVNISNVAASGTTILGLNSDASFTLRGALNEDTWLVIRPSSATPVDDDNTDVSGPSYEGSMFLEPRGDAPPYHSDGNQIDPTIDQALLLQQIVTITCDHWYAGLLHMIGGSITTYISEELDSRDWDTTPSPTLAALTSNPYAAREIVLDGEEKLGEYLSNELLANACGLGTTTDNRITVFPFRQPTPEIDAVEIPEADLSAEWIDEQELLNDGAVVNKITFKSGSIEINASDTRSIKRYGQGEDREVELRHMRRSGDAQENARDIAQIALARPLAFWSHPVFCVMIQVPLIDYVSTVFVGTWVKYTSSLLPDLAGDRGASSITAQVIEQQLDITGNKMNLRLMLTRTVYGYSPCVRVDAISGDTITIGAEYIGVDGDYAWSTLDTYTQEPEDGGLSWFKEGFVCQLISRDEFGDRETGLVIESINLGAKTITFTAAIPDDPIDWAAAIAGGTIVDLRFDSYSACTSEQKSNWAWVGSDADGVIDATDTKNQEWAS